MDLPLLELGDQWEHLGQRIVNGCAIHQFKCGDIFAVLSHKDGHIHLSVLGKDGVQITDEDVIERILMSFGMVDEREIYAFADDHFCRYFGSRLAATT